MEGNKVGNDESGAYLWFCFKISNSEGPTRDGAAEGLGGTEVILNYYLCSVVLRAIIHVGSRMKMWSPGHLEQ